MQDPGFNIILVLLLVGGFALWKTLRGESLLETFDEQDAEQRIPLPDPRRDRDGAPERVGFASIRFADPHFELDAFYARVSEMFLAYHEALERGDLKFARRFIDERYYSALLAEFEKSPMPPVPGSGAIAVESARAMTATHEAGMDQVRVIINARRGGADAPLFIEYWTLIRRQGAITKADLSLYKCPNCGGPTDGDDPTRCGYCGARLADPALDWVVTRIRTD